MSLALYEKLQAQVQLYQKLGEAEAESASGAQKDLTEILEYIQADNPRSALDILDQIDQAVTNLELFPLMGQVPKDSRLQLLNYRTLIVGSYLIFYVVMGSTIEKSGELCTENENMAFYFNSDSQMATNVQPFNKTNAPIKQYEVNPTTNGVTIINEISQYAHKFTPIKYEIPLF